MHRGDLVTFGGKHFYVCGVDPTGVNPRLVYLQNPKTGRRISVPVEGEPPELQSRLRLLS
jgi:hypothetical protein